MTASPTALALVERQFPQAAAAEQAPRPPLVFESLGDMCARIDAAGPPQWLLRGIWPADAYGVLAAEDKAGKSWAACDAAVSVASGGTWLNSYECDTPGPVLLLAGEGGARNLVRRIRAIAGSKGLEAAALGIRLCERVPHLTRDDHLQLIAKELAAHRARLVILDPLYLAARGASGSDLYAMGEALEGLQHACQTAGAALLVVTHFNKTGEGRGAKRITGVGPGAWGRVLITAHIEHRDTDPHTRASTVVLGFDMIGGEIADTTLRIKRRVWADDPDDLGSPLNYEVDVVDDDPFESDDSGAGLTPKARRVLGFLAGTPITVRDLGDLCAGEGRPLKARTIQVALNELDDAGLAESLDGAGPRGALSWVKKANP